METQQARQIVSEIPAQHRKALEAAHLRYMHFTGVAYGEVSKEQIAHDRATYSHLLKYADDGRPSLSDERCADFMAAITGLSRDWCSAWDEVEFVETHGEDFLEAQIKRQESDRIAAEVVMQPSPVVM